MSTGMGFKSVQKKVEQPTADELKHDPGATLFETSWAEPITIPQPRAGNVRARACTVYLTIGCSMSVSSNMHLEDIHPTTINSITMKMCGCHINMTVPPGATAPTMRMGKSV